MQEKTDLLNALINLTIISTRLREHSLGPLVSFAASGWTKIQELISFDSAFRKNIVQTSLFTTFQQKKKIANKKQSFLFCARKRNVIVMGLILLVCKMLISIAYIAFLIIIKITLKLKKLIQNSKNYQMLDKGKKLNE